MTELIEADAKVLFHLNEGFTKVLITYPWGKYELDISTESIPFDLRKIGSRFTIIFKDKFNKIEITKKVRAFRI
jgi:hypothetical protein